MELLLQETQHVKILKASMLNKTLIIAEAGVNHNGDIDIAKQMIDIAAEVGVDYVKFQTFKTEKLVNKAAKKAEYQAKNSGDTDDTQFAMLKKLELTGAMHEILIDYCRERNIRFLSTPFDEDSARYLSSLGIKIGKIPSGEITNLPFLRTMAACFPELILSTGMSTMEDVEAALQALTNAGAKKENITILHCNTEYPTPFTDVNLKAMLFIQRKTGVRIGYSDHTLGIEVPIAAVALGAVVIEKHFTLDRSLSGPDHKASLEPSELKAMVSAIRNIESSLGSEKKEPSQSERKNMSVARKSIHIKQNLSADHILTAADLVMKRPGDGISPMEFEKIIGRKLKNNLCSDHMLTWNDLM